MLGVDDAPAVAGPLEADVFRVNAVERTAPPLVGNSFALAYGYAIPVAFVVMLGLVARGRLRRRWLFLPPGAYILIGAAIFASAYLFG